MAVRQHRWGIVIDSLKSDDRNLATAMRARPVSFAFSSHSKDNVSCDQAEQAAKENGAGATAPFHLNTLLGGQGFDSRLRGGQADPGSFAIKLDRENLLSLSQQRDNVLQIALSEGFQCGPRNAGLLAALDRLDGVLGILKTGSRALPVAIGGSSAVAIRI
jgi:hypothetical protein